MRKDPATPGMYLNVSVGAVLAVMAFVAQAAAEVTPVPKPPVKPTNAVTLPSAVKAAAKQRPKVAIDCMASDIDAKEGTWESQVRISGGNIDETCAVDFKRSVGGLVPLTPVFRAAAGGAAASITVTIPRYTNFGGGILRIYPKSSPPLPQANAPDPGWAFEYSIKSPATSSPGECDIFITEPAEAAPNSDVILWGNNMSDGCGVVFMALPPNFVEPYPATGVLMGGNPVVIDGQRIKVVVPMMSAGPAMVRSFRRGMPNTMKSVATMTVKYIAPVLKSVSPSSSYPGKPVTLLGQAFQPPVAEPLPLHRTHEDLRVRLQYLGQTVDLMPEHVPGPPPIPGLPAALQVHQLLVALPNPFPGLTHSDSTKNGVAGTISVYRHDTTYSSAPMPFTFKPYPPSAAPSTPSSGSSCPSPGWVSCGVPNASGSCVTMQCCPTQGAGGQCNPTKFGDICCKPF